MCSCCSARFRSAPSGVKPANCKLAAVAARLNFVRQIVSRKLGRLSTKLFANQHLKTQLRKKQKNLNKQNPPKAKLLNQLHQRSKQNKCIFIFFLNKKNTFWVFYFISLFFIDMDILFSTQQGIDNLFDVESFQISVVLTSADKNNRSTNSVRLNEIKLKWIDHFFFVLKALVAFFQERDPKTDFVFQSSNTK